MQSYYDLKPLCDQLHQERLREIKNQRYAKQMKAGYESQEGLQRVGFAWSNTMTKLLHWVRITRQAMVARAMKG